MTDASLATPFADPVDDCQRSFRAVLRAMSRPGTVEALDAAGAPPPLGGAAWALCLTLADLETPVWAAPEVDSPALRRSLSFHCGCPLAAEPGNAAFVLADGATLPALDRLAVGTDESPERGATLIAQVAGFGGGRTLTLSGPGIRTTATLSVEGLDPALLPALADNRRLFPSGFDVVFAAPGAVAALPRTTLVEEA